MKTNLEVWSRWFREETRYLMYILFLVICEKYMLYVRKWYVRKEFDVYKTKSFIITIEI